MKKKKSLTKLKKQADELWSWKVRSVCMCELCESKGDIKSFDAHHIRRRSNYSTRWDVLNGACLCKGCHRFKVHVDTLTAAMLVEKLIKKRNYEWYVKLYTDSTTIVKVNRLYIESAIERLKECQ
jgi:hypothetical protein